MPGASEENLCKLNQASYRLRELYAQNIDTFMSQYRGGWARYLILNFCAQYS